MTAILAIATILGGVAAVVFFWDRIAAALMPPPSRDPETSPHWDQVIEQLQELKDRPAVLLPKGSQVIGEPWPHKGEDLQRLQRARDLVRRAAAVVRSTPAGLRPDLEEAIARFEQRVQFYDCGQLAPYSLEQEHARLERLLDTIERSRGTT